MAEYKEGGIPAPEQQVVQDGTFVDGVKAVHASEAVALSDSDSGTATEKETVRKRKRK